MRRALLLFMLVSSFIWADPLPWPLDIEISPSGSYAEFRGFHFHTGIDLRTRQKTGFPVRAIADGFVSRLKIQHRGFGYALYIDYPELGIRSVYGHLEDYAGEIGAFAQDKLNKMDAFYGIEDNFPANKFPVKKGQIVAYTGESGIGPAHLHFELRHFDDVTIAPSSVGYIISEKIVPKVLGIYFEPLSPETCINGQFTRHSVPFTKVASNSFSWNQLVKVSGRAGIKLGIVDQGTSGSVMGVEDIQLFFDGKKIFQRSFNLISYDENVETPYVYDYHMSQMKGMGYVYNLFKWPFEKNGISKDYSPWDGCLDPNSVGTHQVKIICRDFCGNDVIVEGPVQIEKSASIESPGDRQVEVTNLVFTPFCVVAEGKIKPITPQLKSGNDHPEKIAEKKINGLNCSIPEIGEKVFPAFVFQNRIDIAFPFSKDLKKGVKCANEAILPPLEFFDQSGGELMYENSIKMVFPKDSVNLPIVANLKKIPKKVSTKLKVCSPVWQFQPGEAIFAKPVSVEISEFSASPSKQLGVYEVNNSGVPSYLGGTIENSKLKFSGRNIPNFVVLEDSIKPEIKFLGSRVLKHYGPVWAYHVSDVGSGVNDDGYSVKVGGKKGKFDTDPDKSEFYVQKPSKNSGKSFDLEITLSDNAGNVTKLNEKRK
ncbi:MAG: M23 family metallopeptidase [Candidatus Riflebacteria bacterium]|nr:M23 family metallopeptidase [Candidatus Riflebacteria bacterium]